MSVLKLMLKCVGLPLSAVMSRPHKFTRLAAGVYTQTGSLRNRTGKNDVWTRDIAARGQTDSKPV